MNLFKPVIPKTRLHPNFRMLSAKYTHYEKDVLQDWAKGFDDRDGKFVKEFQSTFNSSFWELYLFAALKELGLDVDFSHSAPDFVICNYWCEFSIEAVIASNAMDAPPEWQKDWEKLKNRNLDVVVDESTVRLANALTSKYQKYRDNYSSLDTVKDRPFVLAVAPFEQAWAHAVNDQAMLRVLYGYDKPEMRFSGGPRATAVRHLYKSEIRKASGAVIPLRFFLGGQMPEISAVIFSNCATSSKVTALSKNPDIEALFLTMRYNAHGDRAIMATTRKSEYRETLLDGIRVFHNVDARYPLESRIFDRPGVIQYFYERNGASPKYFGTDGSLIQRNVIKFLGVSDLEKALAALQPSSEELLQNG